MTSPSIDAEQPNPAIRPVSRSRFRRLSPAAKYTAAIVILGMVAVIVQLVVHAMKTEPRDSRMIADRELEVNVLEPGERPLHVVSVVQRSPVDYFRATRGILALTNKRIVYLGLRPRDMLAPEDAPPTFEQRDFPIDTAVSVTAGRAMAMLSKGLIVHTPDETIRLAVPGSSWVEARQLVTTMDVSRKEALATAQRQETLRERAAAEWKRAVAEWHKPQYYTLRRGDALGSVARQWNTTPEKLRELNDLPNNQVRLGQKLLVREGID